MGLYVPVMEFSDFVQTGRRIDALFYMQHFPGVTDGSFNERFKEEKCRNEIPYREKADGSWMGHLWGYGEMVKIGKLSCLSYMATATFISSFIVDNFRGKTIMFDRAEHFLHPHYGQKAYWEARRSMRFAKQLRVEADLFRKDRLQSTDEGDETVLGDDWRLFQPERGQAVGGPYIGVHLRRKDFAISRRSTVPSLESAAAEVKTKLEKFNLSTVFLATDAPADEIAEFRSYFADDVQVEWFKATEEHRKKYLDGGLAIVDQWICAHSRYFIGTHESTFSFRIHEEREILGFRPATTYNRFCGREEAANCDQPSRWVITYDDSFMTGRFPDEL